MHEIIRLDDLTGQFNIEKSDNDKRLAFGWANVAIRKNGEQIIDYQGDMFDPEDLEEAAYKYVLNFRDAGEEHLPFLRKKAKMVESVVFTKEKLQAMGLPGDALPQGWWIGFKVFDDDTWEKIKNGTYKMFSIEGTGIRQPVPEEDLKKGNATGSYTFEQMLRKYNLNHDPATGRFTSGSAIGGISSRTVANGGISVHVKSGREPKSGYMCAVYTDRSTWLKGDTVKDPKKRTAAIKEFMEKNKDVLSDPDNFLGTWYDTETGNISLDISKNFKNKDEAIKFASEHNEKAIWDVANMAEISTGGTGNNL